MGKGRQVTSAARSTQTNVAAGHRSRPLHEAQTRVETLHATFGNAGVGRLARTRGHLPTAVAAELARCGEPLDGATRALMERRFGADFGRVRVHADTHAGTSAAAIGARAYAFGDHVVFAPGRYAPRTRDGLRLLAHELAHTIQQQRAVDAAPTGPVDRALEAGAEQAAHRFDNSDAQLDVTGVAAPALALAKDDEGAGTEEDVAAYQRLRQLQEQADARAAEEYEKHMKRQQEKHPGKKPYGDVTVGVGIALDEEGKPRTIISTNQGARRGIKTGPDDVFAGPAVPRKRAPRKKKTEQEDPGAGASTPTAAAHPAKPPPRPRRKTDAEMTRQDAERHAEANVTAAAKKRDWQVIAVGASRDVCRYCGEKIGDSGGTVATEHRKRHEIPDESVKPNITGAVQALKKAGQLAQPPPAPVVEQRHPGPPTGSGGGAAPPSATKGGVPSANPPAAKGPQQKVTPPSAAMADATTVHSSVPAKAPPTSPAHTDDPGKSGAAPLPPAPKPKSASSTNSSPPGGTTLKAPAPPNAKPAPPPATTKAESDPPPDPGAPATAATHPAPKTAGTTAAKPTPPAQVAPTPPHEVTTEPAKVQTPPKGAAVVAAAKTQAGEGGHEISAAKPNLANVEAQAQTKAAAPASLESGAPDLSGQPARTTKTTGDLSGLKRATETTEQHGPVTKTTTSTTSATWGGVSRSQETLRRDDEGRGTATKSTIGVTRGEGRLGVGRTESKRTGELDEEGGLLKGRERTSHVGGGLIAGDQGVGAFGTASTETTTAHGKGVTTKQSFGINGEFVVDVKEVPGKSPAQYQISLTISLGAHAGVGASAGETTTASLTGSASGAVSGTFVHTFSAEETAKYLGALRGNGVGGAERELKVIELAAGGSLDDAKQLLQTLQAGAMSAEAARTMTPGDSATFGAEGKVEGGLGLGAGGKGGPSVGAEVSFSKSGSLKRTVSRRADGKVVVTVEVVGETGGTVGGTAGYGVVSAGVSYGRTSSKGRAVAFELDPKDPDYTARFDSIAAAESIDQLNTLATRDPSLVGETEESKGWSTTLTPKVGVAGAELAISEKHSYKERVRKGKHGTTTEYGGASGGGIDVGVQGGPKLSYSQTQAVTTEVGPNKKAKGDVSTTTSETDVGGSLAKLAQRAEDKPIGTALGLATGGTKVLGSHTEVVGMKLSDDDYGSIAASAGNSKVWSKAFRGHVNQSYSAWMRLGDRIAAAEGDREHMAKLLAQYASENDGAAEAVQSAVRPVGTTAGGIRYDWPEELASEKETFDALVVDDALAGETQLASKGNFEEALAKMNADVGKLTKLAQKIERNEKFSDGAAVIEMLRRIGDRLTEYRGEIRKLKKALTPTDEPPKGKPGAEAGKEDTAEKAEAKAEANARREERNQKIDRLIPALLKARDHERAVFAALDKELNDPPWYRNTDVIETLQKLNTLQGEYAQWDLTVNELKAVFKERGEDESRADQYAPDRAGWKARRYHKELTKWG